MAAVTYWRLPEEDDTFLTYLERSEDIVACTHGWVASPESLKSLPIREFIESKEPERLIFGSREFMEMTPIMSMEQEGRTVFSRIYSRGPVIAYSRGKWRGPGRLGQSNLVFNLTRGVLEDSIQDGLIKVPRPPSVQVWDVDKTTFIPQPPEFIRWARRVMQWMRRHTRPHGYYRVTPRVAAEVENGLELVH